MGTHGGGATTEDFTIGTSVIKWLTVSSCRCYENIYGALSKTSSEQASVGRDIVEF